MMADYIDRQDVPDTNVGDMISRQAAVSGISDLLMLELKGERLPTYNEVYRAIYDLPSIDAVTVVRCKDCKYFDSGTDEDGKLFFKCLGWVYGGISEDDFCSYGERK